MPAQIYPLLAPRAGLNRDNPANLITDLEMSDCRNILTEDGMLRKRSGLSTFATNYALGSDIVGGDQLMLYDGTKHLVCMTPTDAYRYNTALTRWERITNGQSIDTCEAGWVAGSGDTLEHDAADYVSGAGSVKITLAAERTGVLLAYQGVNYSPALNISTHKKIAFWIKSSIALAVDALEVVVTESAGGAKTGSHVACLSTILAADTWTYVELDKTLTDLDAVLSVGLYANTTIAIGTIIHLDAVRAVTLYTGDDNNFIDISSVRGKSESDVWMVYTNGVDAIQKWTGSGTATDLVADIKAKYLIEFKNYLVLGHTIEGGEAQPQRVRWSDTGDPAVFTGGNSGFIDLGGNDFITGFKKFRADYLMVFKEQSIWLLTVTGDTDPFEPQQVVKHTGCPAARTAQNIGVDVFFMGWDDIYSFNGIEAKSLTNAKVRREIIHSVDPENIGRSFAVNMGDIDEYWLFVPKTGSTYPDTVWAYNYAEKSWYRHDFNLSITAIVPFFQYSGKMIGQLVGTIGDQLWRIGERGFVANAPTFMFGDADGNTYVYDLSQNNDVSSAIDGWFSTKDFMLAGLNARQRILRLDVWWQGGSMTVDYSTNQGSSWTTLETLGSNTVIDVDTLYARIDSNMVRFRFRNNTVNETFQFREARLHWRPAGERI